MLYRFANTCINRRFSWVFSVTMLNVIFYFIPRHSVRFNHMLLNYNIDRVGPITKTNKGDDKTTTVIIVIITTGSFTLHEICVYAARAMNSCRHTGGRGRCASVCAMYDVNVRFPTC